MRNNFYSSIAFGFAALLFVSDLSAQASRGRYDTIASTRRQADMHSEILTIPNDTESGTVIFSFRLPHERLVFMKEAAGENASSFVARPEILVDIFKDGKLIKEETWLKEKKVDAFEETKDPNQDLQGFINVELEPGEYAYRIGIRDNRTEEASYSPGRPFVLANPSEFTVGSAMYASAVEIGSDWISADRHNIGKKIPFGSESYAVVPFSLGENVSIDDVNITYSLREMDADQLFKMSKKRRRVMEKQMKANRGRKNKETKLVMEYQTDEDAKGSQVVDKPIESSQIYFLNANSIGEASAEKLTFNMASSDEGQYVAIIDLDGGQLENGTYQFDLVIEKDGKKEQSRNRFLTYWKNMPLSLYDPEVAMKVLEPLVGRKAANKLAKGDRKEVIEKFRQFWKERDPSPGTVYNELMEEYYSRVDYAATEFRSQGRRARTATDNDRAKTYIIQGPPDNIEREFPNDGGVIEVWSYSDGSVYTFRAYSSLDDYELINKASKS